MVEQRNNTVQADVARVAREIEAFIGKEPASRLIGQPGGVEILHTGEDMNLSALVGRSLGAESSRDLFYSALGRAVRASALEVAPASDWAGFLRGLLQKGVTAEEVEWSGAMDWLSQRRGRIAKAELLAFIESQAPRIQVVELCEAKDLARKMSMAMADEGFSVEHDPIDQQFLFLDEDGDLIDFQELPLDVQAIVSTSFEVSPDAARYAEKTLPGGLNYRELLLTLPAGASCTIAQRNAEGERVWAVVDSAGHNVPGTNCYALEHKAREEARQVNQERGTNSFLNSHWATPNVLAHIRVSDHLDHTGQRTLFVEEIQSDWGQALRGKNLARAGAAPSVVDVPEAPFVRSTSRWLGLALKQVLATAVVEEYDRVAFINGQQSADRYGLDGAARKGMMSFYDDIVPKAVRSLLSRMGVVIQGHSFDVSPDIAAAVRAGMPLFSLGTSGPQAMYWPSTQTAFFFADRIEPGHERAVFLHEVMHAKGPAALGRREIQRLANQVIDWSEHSDGTLERLINERAVQRASQAQTYGRSHYEEELIAYAVEEAVLLGVTPDISAEDGSAQAWIADAATTLQGALFTATAGGLPVLSAQDLVNMAYAIAMLKAPCASCGNESAAERWRRSESARPI